MECCGRGRTCRPVTDRPIAWNAATKSPKRAAARYPVSAPAYRVSQRVIADLSASDSIAGAAKTANSNSPAIGSGSHAGGQFIRFIVVAPVQPVVTCDYARVSDAEQQGALVASRHTTDGLCPASVMRPPASFAAARSRRAGHARSGSCQSRRNPRREPARIRRFRRAGPVWRRAKQGGHPPSLPRRTR